MIYLWALRIIPAILLIQTLRYKFTAHPESVGLFTKVSPFNLPEKYSRIGIGVLELIFGVLILIPQVDYIGAIGAIVLMLGALFFHVTKIGFKGNNLPLAITAFITLVCSILIVLI